MAKSSRRIIRNGTAFPLSLKNAALSTWDTTVKSKSKIANEYNVSKATMTKWIAERGLQRGATPPGIARHYAALATTKKFNTPTLQNDGTILYRGKSYREELDV